jgi:hypothetical protein
MERHEHNTRLTPEKRQHGGHREGAGKPAGQENHNPNKAAAAATARQQRRALQEKMADCSHQQQELANAEGRSYEECKLILTLVFGLILQYGETPTDALRHASTLIHRSYANLHALWSHWRNEQEIFVVDTSQRGAGAATHLHHAHHVSVDVIFYITEYIRDANQTGGGCTSKSLQDAILAEHHTRLSDRVLRSVLSSMGFRYGRGNVIGKMNDPGYVARIRVFLVRYSKAVLEQQRGECVIVYTDESYVNTHHAPSFTWYHPGLPEKNDVVRPSGKGKRLVLVHAFTKDGWLSDNFDVHNNCVDAVIPSCELIYEAKKDDGDYHDNMNGSIYMRWLSNRLLPAFNKRYPGKKMVLVLDNASYHHHRGADWINVHRLCKAELAAKLIELGVSIVVVQRQRKGTTALETLRFDAATFSQRGGAYAPTLAELKAELKAWLDAHPERNKTEVHKLFSQHGYELVYTPPYQPAVQPIERLWAYIKNYVASRYRTGRGMRELLAQTYQGFYGDGDKHAGVDHVLCAKMIEGAHSFCNHLIDQDDAVDGTIYDLKTAVEPSLPDIEADIDAEIDPFPDVEEE